MYWQIHQVFFVNLQKAQNTNTNYSDHLSPSSGIAMWWQIHQVFANWQKSTSKHTNTKYTTCHHDQLLQCNDDRSSTAFQMQFVSFISVFDFSTFNWKENTTETINCEVLNWNILESRCWGKKRICWETMSSARSRRKCQASTFSWSYRSCTSLGEARTRWFNLVVRPS